MGASSDSLERLPLLQRKSNDRETKYDLRIFDLKWMEDYSNMTFELRPGRHEICKKICEVLQKNIEGSGRNILVHIYNPKQAGDNLMEKANDTSPDDGHKTIIVADAFARIGSDVDSTLQYVNYDKGQKDRSLLLIFHSKDTVDDVKNQFYQCEDVSKTVHILFEETYT